LFGGKKKKKKKRRNPKDWLRPLFYVERKTFTGQQYFAFVEIVAPR